MAILCCSFARAGAWSRPLRRGHCEFRVWLDPCNAAWVMDKHTYTADEAQDRDHEDEELYAQPDDDDPEVSLFHEIDLHLAPHA